MLCCFRSQGSRHIFCVRSRRTNLGFDESIVIFTYDNVKFSFTFAFVFLYLLVFSTSNQLVNRSKVEGVVLLMLG